MFNVTWKEKVQCYTKGKKGENHRTRWLLQNFTHAAFWQDTSFFENALINLFGKQFISYPLVQIFSLQIWRDSVLSTPRIHLSSVYRILLLAQPSTMRRASKRKATKKGEAKSSEEHQRAPSRAKRVKASKPKSEPEFFPDQRNLVQVLHLFAYWYLFISYSLLVFDCKVWIL